MREFNEGRSSRVGMRWEGESDSGREGEGGRE